ncbi:MAG TPA: hypothetical protein VJ741_06710 [Solirubrobacteraceae bacterium]|nr:hypothetical protein [Solirubrobacteraceae bacterium]
MSSIAVRVPVGRSEPTSLEAWVDDAGNLVIPASALPRARRGSANVLIGREGGSPPVSRLGLLAVAAATAVMIAVIAVFAANGRQWPWTGFADSTSLWNWLHLLVQPIALSFLTVRLLMGAPLRVGRRVGVIGAVLLAVLILAGYAADWTWTGFPGKALWDWLSLMLFPVVVIVLPEWIRRGEPFGPRARAAAMVALGAFVLLVIGGYHWGWTWTGFTGNTFRDWLDLMIAPFLLPVALKVVHTLHIARGATSSAPAPDDLVVRVTFPR